MQVGPIIQAECNAMGVGKGRGRGTDMPPMRIYEKKMQTEYVKINTNRAAVVADANCSWIFTYRRGDNNWLCTLHAGKIPVNFIKIMKKPPKKKLIKWGGSRRRRSLKNEAGVQRKQKPNETGCGRGNRQRRLALATKDIQRGAWYGICKGAEGGMGDVAVAGAAASC